jgi:hypothetical protein
VLDPAEAGDHRRPARLHLSRVGHFAASGVVSGASGILLVQSVKWTTNSSEASLQSPRESSSNPATGRVRWLGRPGAGFVVEASPELNSWKGVEADIREPDPGQFEARISEAGEHQFYRILLRAATTSSGGSP